MKQTDWTIIYNSYEGPEKRAVDLLSKEVGKHLIRQTNVYTIYVLPCRKDGYELTKNAIILGCYDESKTVQKFTAREEVPADGFLVKVIENPQDPEGRLVILTAHSPRELFYAAVSFVDDYIPGYAPRNGANLMPDLIFDTPLQLCSYTETPDHKTRSVFTWAHPINNYRAYIDNMARLKLNELILWNDFVPLNIAEVIDYAHSYGIAVNLGYSWGWLNHQCAGITDVSDAALVKMKDEIIRKYEVEYAPTNCDGIYFQSFTERKDEYIGGRLIAEAVTSLVNMTCGELLEKYPGLKLQFGLHASSVRAHLDEIAKVDPRVQILWEDCGTFPYNYRTYVSDEEKYEKTMAFTKQLLNLRGGRNVGLVFKSVMMLDWTRFEYQSGPFVMGENHPDIIAHDKRMRARSWREYTADWLRNGDRAQQMVKFINDNKLGEVDMCLAGTFDGGIYMPQAIYAQMLRSMDDDYGDILQKVGRRFCITVD